jgi:23S rRNA (cytidine1920-2'-O)/16S rRNA (cytidine1409-2'-O)-methyltransferase
MLAKRSRRGAAMSTPDPPHPFVGRGGLKLRHALDEFGIDPRGWACADFGANIGGFTDCLLRAGAARVLALDTGYGTLAWTLRRDPRVTVMERRNALHTDPPVEGGAPLRVDLVAIDLGWTPQRLAVPAAARWLRPGGSIVSLIKPHYEIDKSEAGLLREGVLDEADAERVAQRTAAAMPGLGVELRGLTRSPITGGATKKNPRGNAEWLAWLVLGPRP